MNNYLELAYRALFFAPAFVANASPLIAKNVLRNRHPIDFGKNFVDGKRIFGENKSWEGFIVGVFVSTLVGIALSPLYSYMTLELAIAGFVQGLGSMVGDLANSFLKRRLDLRPGAPLPVLDQVSFIVASLIFTRILGVDQLVGIKLRTIEILLVIAVALVLHPLTNYIAYLLKLKEVPY